MDRGQIFRLQAGHAPLKEDWALDTRQAVGVHTGAGGQCADAIEGGR